MAGFTITNNVALRNWASSRVYEKLVQDILHVAGKGVDESWVVGNTNNHSIAIPRVALGEGAFRRLGAAVNGGQFNTKDAVNPESDYIEVPLTFVYDRTEDIGEVYQDKAGYDLMGAKLDNIRKKLARNINALTFAVQFSTALNGAYDKTTALIVCNSSTGDPLGAITTANANLSEGDEAIGVDYFPTENRQGFVRPTFFARLKTATGRYIINSDYGQQMLASGLLNPWKQGDTAKVEIRDGYCGKIDGVDFYEVSPVLWKLAASYLTVGSTAAAENLFGNVEGAITSSLGTIRGFTSTGNVKIIDNPNGQGYRIQPLVHGGCVCISAKSVQMIVNETFANPVTSAATKLGVVAPESK